MWGQATWLGTLALQCLHRGIIRAAWGQGQGQAILKELLVGRMSGSLVRKQQTPCRTTVSHGPGRQE